MWRFVLMSAADLVDTVGAVPGKVGRFSTLAALPGIALTSVFLMKPIERRDRTVMRMGVDCLAALIVCIGGVFMPYRIAQPMRGRWGQLAWFLALLRQNVSGLAGVSLLPAV
ncbi:hypothetical protein IWX87_003090 [Polaromonas sp. CG_9.7]|nr:MULTISPECIES: hypothetical protein [unclassified Polaromonas]MBG6073317.1 hypothetical protein [Polaromonas sp. CG_9.7]MBG6115343.1 hypothetical protein [Polaromonas sp. CG_9.2]MDH6182952.1 hypothetical protein [Polaromonas sp. CG_23.6]